jgi:hypothetical protein
LLIQIVVVRFFIMEKEDKIRMIPAIPPEDYKGSQGDWHIALIERDLWDGKGWHGDVEIPSNIWWEILEQCES